MFMIRKRALHDAEKLLRSHAEDGTDHVSLPQPQGNQPQSYVGSESERASGNPENNSDPVEALDLRINKVNESISLFDESNVLSDPPESLRSTAGPVPSTLQYRRDVLRTSPYHVEQRHPRLTPSPIKQEYDDEGHIVDDGRIYPMRDRAPITHHYNRSQDQVQYDHPWPSSAPSCSGWRRSLGSYPPQNRSYPHPEDHLRQSHPSLQVHESRGGGHHHQLLGNNHAARWSHRESERALRSVSPPQYLAEHLNSPDPRLPCLPSPPEDHHHPHSSLGFVPSPESLHGRNISLAQRSPMQSYSPYSSPPPSLLNPSDSMMRTTSTNKCNPELRNFRIKHEPPSPMTPGTGAAPATLTSCDPMQRRHIVSSRHLEAATSPQYRDQSAECFQARPQTSMMTEYQTQSRARAAHFQYQSSIHQAQPVANSHRPTSNMPMYQQQERDPRSLNRQTSSNERPTMSSFLSMIMAHRRTSGGNLGPQNAPPFKVEPQNAAPFKVEPPDFASTSSPNTMASPLRHELDLDRKIQAFERVSQNYGHPSTSSSSASASLHPEPNSRLIDARGIRSPQKLDASPVSPQSPNLSGPKSPSDRYRETMLNADGVTLPFDEPTEVVESPRSESQYYCQHPKKRTKHSLLQRKSRYEELEPYPSPSEQSPPPSVGPDSSVVKGKRGRPRKHAPKIPLPPLYVFIRNMLHNSAYNPKTISWVNESVGVFKVTNTQDFACTWGRMKSNRSEEMNYEKMSRAMRYHYGSEKQGRKGHLAMVKEKRLVYRFGELAINWRTEEVELNNCDIHDLCKGSLCLWSKE